MDHQGGKRVIKGDRTPRGAKADLIVILVLAAVLIAGYVGLCAYVDRAGTFLPNTAIAGVDVGGMTQAEASSALAGQLPGRLSQLSASFLCGGAEYAVSGAEFSFDEARAAQQAIADQHGSFFLGGWHYLSALLGRAEYPVPLSLDETPRAVAQAIEDCTDPEAQTTWEQTDRSLVFRKGVTCCWMTSLLLTPPSRPRSPPRPRPSPTCRPFTTSCPSRRRTPTWIRIPRRSWRR